MIVVVNGTATQLPDGATVRAVVEVLELPAQARGVAVAVDAEVVPRGEWDAYRLGEGARIEVVRAVQGG